MAERTLRGARLGGQSFEDERGIEFAARQQVGYRCPQGHEFEITMSDEADVPAEWECTRCGEVALSTSGIVPVEKVEKPVRTHWDMLLERRSVKELGKAAFTWMRPMTWRSIISGSSRFPRLQPTVF